MVARSEVEGRRRSWSCHTCYMPDDTLLFYKDNHGSFGVDSDVV